MKKVAIFYNRLYDFKSNKLLIGGIQTYITDLAGLFVKANYEVRIYILRIGETNDTNKIEINNFSIIEIFGKSYEIIFRSIEPEYNDDDIIILATEDLKIKSKRKNAITIQHGISWDYPGSALTHKIFKYKWLQDLRKIYKSLSYTQSMSFTKNLVCVDYNFFNWYRTLRTIPRKQVLKVIPNYCSGLISENELLTKLHQDKTEKSIVFARRFVKLRGVLIFIKVVKRLLKEFENISITFAGDGEYYDTIVQEFRADDKVFFTKYKSNDSINFHKNFDIAVIPTIYSEGTSLSLLEAMASGCFPIATHVGGLTNILIDNFNGYLIYPEEEELFDALRKCLLLPNEEFNRIVKNAYNTTSQSFTKDQWENRWLDLIEKIQE